MEAHEDNYNDNIEILYERLLPSCKVRTINALNTWRREYQDFQKFFHHFLSATIFEMSHRHNCGRQTIRDILDFLISNSIFSNFSIKIDTIQDC